MMRSMDSAITGLSAFQTQMDVIGNNVANVNTVGFKSSSPIFSQLLTQTLRGATAPTAKTGGVNPSSIGLGVGIGAIQQNMGQGSIQTTGNKNDLAISGQGFFAVQGANGPLYTRNGAFTLDANGNLVDAAGHKVLGWMASSTGTINTQNPATGIAIPIGQSTPPVATTSATLTGNLNANDTSGQTYNLSTQVYDSLGNPQPVTITMTKGSTNNTWSWTATNNGATVGSGSLTFNASGQLTSPTSGTGTINFTPTDGASPVAVTLQLSQLEQVASSSTAVVSSVNGAAGGSLNNYSIGSNGAITASYSNGTKSTLGQIAIAMFNNPSGLQAGANNTYAQSANSGTAALGTPGKNGAGTFLSGSLESSNVDLARQFTDMVVAERAFQANAQVITTGSTMLQTLVQMTQ